MAQSPEAIAHEAKAVHSALKDLLKAKDPWDRDVEFQRKRLRRLRLALLLTHPYEKESQDVENHLWMQTSYSFISLYKQRIAAFDKPPDSLASQQPRPKNSQNVVENRKIIQRFRQFLAEEERFYMQLVARCRRTFGLEEVHPMLVTLGVVSAEEDGSQPTVSNGHNHYQFPPEDMVNQLPADNEQRKGRNTQVAVLLICLGDIARYRELYNESGGRPKAGHEDGPPKKGGRSRKGGLAPSEVLAKARNYERALAYYEQAKLIAPNHGHAFHQLAILASYQRDFFGSLAYYYRALCVRNAYEMASDNMGTMLSRSLTQWKTDQDKFKPEDVSDPSIPLRIRVSIFENHLVALHSLWRISPKKMSQISPSHAKDAAAMFASLVSQRVLPTELISKTIVLTEGALWKHRVVRDKSRTKRLEALSPDDHSTVEACIFSHLLSFHKVLLDEGKTQIEELHHSDAHAEDLAQRITATFRRTLPALRIASKWLRANLKYFQGRKEATLSPFWDSYSAFIRTLARAFPFAKLPTTRAFLDEDTEMRGFTPLKGFMGSEVVRDSGTSSRELAHPNVEQLIRIADLLKDANGLAESPGSPIALYGGHIVVKGPGMEITPRSVQDQASWLPSAIVAHPSLYATSEPEEDARTETTDDPVEDAFRVALDPSNEKDDDDDDEIVWDPNPGSSPLTPPMATIPAPSPVTPIKRPPVTGSPTASITARDLLNNVMGTVRPASSQPQLLFGSTSPSRGPSIWSTSNPKIWSDTIPSPPNMTIQMPHTAPQPPGGFSPPLSRLQQPSYDFSPKSSAPLSQFPGSAHPLQSPPLIPSMSSTFSPNSMRATTAFSMGSVPHPSQYVYDNFAPSQPHLQYGLHYHPRHMSQSG